MSKVDVSRREESGRNADVDWYSNTTYPSSITYGEASSRPAIYTHLSFVSSSNMAIGIDSPQSTYENQDSVVDTGIFRM